MQYSKKRIAKKSNKDTLIKFTSNKMEHPYTDNYFRASSSPKQISFFLFAGLIVLSLSSSKLYAQNMENPVPETKPFRSSISLSSILLLGSLQVNYEHLVGKRHGLMAEGYYAFAGTSAKSWTVGASYRYHLKPSLDGLFFNAFYRHGGQFSNTFKIKESNTTNTYNLKTQLNVVGLGLGNRWQWNNGLAVVARGGYGYQIEPNYKWSPTLPIDTKTRSSREAQLGLDLELSLGYSF
ncbi:MAG: DUF3575 domain-containing protein [Pyrinomonadaceae bacterium]|nr:DUF3575 domain-containing protein [Sphingobacteriaceae bacterium]